MGAAQRTTTDGSLRPLAAAGAAVVLFTTACSGGSSSNSLSDELHELPWSASGEGNPEELPLIISAVDSERFTEAWGEDFPDPEAEVSTESLQPYAGLSDQEIVISPPSHLTHASTTLQSRDEQRKEWGLSLQDAEGYSEVVSQSNVTSRI